MWTHQPQQIRRFAAALCLFLVGGASSSQGFAASTSPQEEGAVESEAVALELTTLTHDGGEWVGAPGVEVRFANPKAVTEWRRAQEDGVPTTTADALAAIGSMVVSDERGVVSLMIPDASVNRISVSGYLDGVTTTSSIRSRDIRAGVTELKLRNGYLEREWIEGFNSMKETAEGYLLFQLVDEAGAPLPHMQVRSMAFFRHQDPYVEGLEGEAAVVLARADSPGPQTTNSQGWTHLAFGREQLESSVSQWITRAAAAEKSDPSSGHWLSDSDEAAMLRYKKYEDYELTELHVLAVSPEPYDNVPITLTTREIIEGPMQPGPKEVGPLFMSRPPVLASGVVRGNDGAPMMGLRVYPPGLKIGDAVFGAPGDMSAYGRHLCYSLWSPTDGSSRVLTVSPENALFVRPNGCMTDESGAFEIRGRVFLDSILDERQTRLSSRDWIHEDLTGLDGEMRLFFDRGDIEGFEWAGEIGSEEIRAAGRTAPRLSAKLTLPEGFPSAAITLYAKRPDGTLAGGPMSLDEEGEILMGAESMPLFYSRSTWGTGSMRSYDHSREAYVPSDIEEGTWDVCFELRSEQDEAEPTPFKVVRDVVFARDTVTEDPRLQGLDLSDDLFHYTLTVLDSKGELVKEALASYWPAGSDRRCLAIIRDGVGNLASSVRAVDVHIEAAGHRPVTVRNVRDNQTIEMSLVGVPVTLSVPEGLEVPSVLGPGDEITMGVQVSLQQRGYTSVLYSRQHAEAGSESRYGSIDLNGEFILTDNDDVAEIAGHKPVGRFDPGARELTLMVPEPGTYRVSWYLFGDLVSESQKGEDLKEQFDLGGLEREDSAMALNALYYRDIEVKPGRGEVQIGFVMSQEDLDKHIEDLWVELWR